MLSVATVAAGPGPCEFSGLQAIDWLVIGGYGLFVVALGWFYSRRQSSTEEYFLAGRRTGALIAGISLFATLIVRGLVEADNSGRKVNVSRGCMNATGLLRQISLANVALGRGGPEIIPIYESLSLFGDIALVLPTCDWYDIRLCIEEKGMEK